MGSYIVYADVLLMLNFILDFFLLWGAGRFLKREVLYRRMIPAAACGAVYGALMAAPVPAWLFTVPAAFAFSLVMLMIAFPFRSVFAFFRLLAAFYLMAFAMGGAALAGAYVLDSSTAVPGVISSVKSVALLFGLIVCLVLGRKGVSAIKRYHRKEEYRTDIVITLDRKSCTLSALIDTGNDLHDPVSDLPVVVAAEKAVLTLFPESVSFLIHEHLSDPVSLFQMIQARDTFDLRNRFRLIPFSSIGKQYGLMIGFKPDRLIMRNLGETCVGDAVVCLASNGLANGEFQAILNPEVFDDQNAGEVSA